MWVIDFGPKVIPNKTITEGEYNKKNRTQFESKIKKIIQKVN